MNKKEYNKELIAIIEFALLMFVSLMFTFIGYIIKNEGITLICLLMFFLSIVGFIVYLFFIERDDN